MIYSSSVSLFKSATSNDPHDAGLDYSWASKKGSNVCRVFSGNAIATRRVSILKQDVMSPDMTADAFPVNIGQLASPQQYVVELHRNRVYL